MKPLAPVAALAAVLVSAGCGTGGITKGGDPSAGKTLFTQKCASCHVLADAGSQVIGHLQVGGPLGHWMPPLVGHRVVDLILRSA